MTNLEYLRSHLPKSRVQVALRDPNLFPEGKILSYSVNGANGRLSMRRLAEYIEPGIGGHTHEIMQVLVGHGIKVFLRNRKPTHDKYQDFIDAGLLIDEDSVEPRHVVERRRVLQEVTQRPGQGRFRDALLETYDRRCALTGADHEITLQAAHIVPVQDGGTDEVSNGLLLRADVHLLFDACLLAFDEGTGAVLLRPELAQTEIGRELATQMLRKPRSRGSKPKPESLRFRRGLAGL